MSSRSIVVLCYAHWEGFCSSCVNIFVDHLESLNLTYGSVPVDFGLGAVSANLDSYRDKADNLNSRIDLARSFRGLEVKPFENFDRKIILPRSNLNFERLRFIFSVINLDVQPFQKHRIRIDNELVKWRHQIAHGQMFTLDDDKVLSHTKFCEELMFLIKDAFEIAISEY